MIRRVISYPALLILAVFTFAPHRLLIADVPLSRLHHTTWTNKDGAPSAIVALAQTPDGLLWLGTSGAGLYSFDGYSFEPFRPIAGPGLPSLSISALAADAQGGLWAGFRYGGIAYAKHGQVTLYGLGEGVHPGNIQKIVVGSPGEAWAIAGGELIRFQHGRWSTFGPSEGDSTNDQHGADEIIYDKQGTLWVVFGEALYNVPFGHTSLERTLESSTYTPALEIGADGNLWRFDQNDGLRSICPNGECSRSYGGSLTKVSRMAFDDSGNLWASTTNGITRIRTSLLLRGSAVQPTALSSALERFTSAQGLTSNYTSAVLSDREGNVWVGTRLGLDRFQEPRFTPILGSAAERNASLAVDSLGKVWIGSHEIGLNLASYGALQAVSGTRYPDDAPIRDHVFLIAPGIGGSIIISDRSGLFRYQNGKRMNIQPFPASDFFPVLAMTESSSLGLLVSVARKGVWRWDREQWTQFNRKPPSFTSTPMSLKIDSRGRLWMGYADGTIAVQTDTTEQKISPAEGLGSALVFHEEEGRMWVGGSAGIAVSDGYKLQPILLEDSIPLRGISGLVHASDGSLWLNGTTGVARLPGEEVKRALREPRYRARFESFDSRDGLEGIASQWEGRPTAARDAGGRLWFSTTGGVYSIDPLHIQRNPSPPLTRVTGVIADGNHIAASESLHLQKPAHIIEISYEGVSLSNPERVRYRYKLEGVDRDWQDAGSRRVAIYTDLRPGAFTFQFIAASADGVWSDASGALRLDIQPAFYQTLWFRALCLFAAFFGFWMLYRVRLRFVIAKVKERLDERGRERVRIARDLHDTLLQGVQGLVLRFHFAAEQVPEQEPARAMLHAALDRADQVIAEGRDRVKHLRGTVCSSDDLAKTLLETATHLKWRNNAEVRVVAVGESRQIQAIVHDEIYCIGREAISNALHHGQPALVEVEITCDSRELRLRCRDNGRGMKSVRMEDLRREEHWGIIGMQERAERIGAKFELWSTPGIGTEIDVRVSGATAYVEGAARLRWNNLRGLFQKLEA